MTSLFGNVAKSKKRRKGSNKRLRDLSDILQGDDGEIRSCLEVEDEKITPATLKKRAAPAPEADEGCSRDGEKENEDDDEAVEVETFEELNLSRALLGACSAMGFRRPFQVQAKCIPAVLKGKVGI